MLNIKLKGMERRTPCKHLFYLYKHPRSVGSDQNVKVLFLNVAVLHIKLKGKKTNIEAKTVTLHTPLTSVSDIEIVQISIFFN